MYGGTCINAGCIPSKSLIHSAAFSNALRFEETADGSERKSALYRQAMEEKRRLTAALRRKIYDKLSKRKNITVLDGSASFIDAHSLNVNTENGSRRIEADTIIINTGATPFLPPIPGLLESRNMYTSETLMELDTLPEKLVIIGGGYIGMEFASMYADFGSDVTVIQDGSRFLSREDEEIASAVLESLTARGITVIRSAKLLSVEDLPAGGTDDAAASRSLVRFETSGEVHTLSADAVLAATGRRPDLAGLHAEHAGIALTEHGAI